MWLADEGITPVVVCGGGLQAWSSALERYRPTIIDRACDDEDAQTRCFDIAYNFIKTHLVPTGRRSAHTGHLGALSNDNETTKYRGGWGEEALALRLTRWSKRCLAGLMGLLILGELKPVIRKHNWSETEMSVPLVKEKPSYVSWKPPSNRAEMTVILMMDGRAELKKSPEKRKQNLWQSEGGIVRSLSTCQVRRICHVT
jgi:hypothetical protein